MFELDARLQSDTVELGEFELSKVLLAKDSRYPWCILVPKINGVSEAYQLSELQQQQLTIESNFLAKQLMLAYKGDSMNVAALGNVVSQLHVHHVVRFKTDASWPGPIWGVGEATFDSEDVLRQRGQNIINLLKSELGFVAAF